MSTATAATATTPLPDEGETRGMEQTTGKIKVTLTGVPETLLISLLGRARDAAARRPILGDPYAEGVMEKLDYDFGQLRLQPTAVAAVSLRTRIYDGWATAFLATHPRATVLHLACGLDSRNQRVDWGASVRWIDVDLPEVAALRRQVLPTSFPGREYRLVAADATDQAWLEEIPTDRPVLVIMEGLLSYFPPAEATGLLGRLVEKLEEGELHFDCMTAKVLKSSQENPKAAPEKAGPLFQWAVDDLKDVERIHPHIKLIEAVRYIEAPGIEKFPFVARATYFVMSCMPSLRDGIRFVRFGFSKGLMDDLAEVDALASPHLH
ncbi:S-adenosyl-L-methionine-dependent methyltransferase [Nemania diffusa]|nr:S-adenosyl-L-methionine-dependent methyltransferase [Nemania diffusa]